MTFLTLTSLMAAGEPAGGAPVQDLLPAAIVGGVLTAVVLAVGLGHRTGRITIIGRAAALAERVIPVPGWAALPVLLTLGSLGVAAFGFFWDVATHIDNGRDAGPFANVSHYPILAGLAGIALAGYVAAVLGADARDRAAISWAPGWRIPLGGALLLLCGGLAMVGFPLDDVWHRIFGQDVTLWGPTHVLMIGGASLAPIAAWLLLVEGRCAVGKPGPGRLLLLAWEVQLAGAALVGLSTLQLEFGYGVPQFQLAFHPILIALAASVGLVAARVRLGRGGALAATGAYLIVMVPMVLIIGPGLGHTFMHFPLYIAEALLVELAALALRGPLRLGIGAGALIGTVGVAAEWGWTQIAMPLPWNAALFPEAPLLALVAAVAGGLIGAHLGGALRSPRRPATMPRLVPVAALAVVIATLAIPMRTEAGPPVRAAVTLDGQGTATATVRLDPPDAAKQAKWFHVMSWQGGGSRRAELREIGSGTYRTSAPVPIEGEWKTMVRLHTGNRILALPIYMPGDPAIPAKEVPARPRFARDFQVDHEVLRREERSAAPWLTGLAYGILAMVALAWLLAIGAAVGRFERRVGRTQVAIS
ncbi:MAG TPA: hypothetical protein VFM58_07555 [Solirubrobacteraceae bacterium]|nr:hypothetical protein [Solirubrobacteraceae bacterium]